MVTSPGVSFCVVVNPEPGVIRVLGVIQHNKQALSEQNKNTAVEMNIASPNGALFLVNLGFKLGILTS